MLSTSLAWPAVAGCSRAETFSQLSSISFTQPCTDFIALCPGSSSLSVEWRTWMMEWREDHVKGQERPPPLILLSYLSIHSLHRWAHICKKGNGMDGLAHLHCAAFEREPLHPSLNDYKLLLPCYARLNSFSGTYFLKCPGERERKKNKRAMAL